MIYYNDLIHSVSKQHNGKHDVILAHLQKKTSLLPTIRVGHLLCLTGFFFATINTCIFKDFKGLFSATHDHKDTLC